MPELAADAPARAEPATAPSALAADSQFPRTGDVQIPDSERSPRPHALLEFMDAPRRAATILAVPIAGRDVLRATFTWDLAIEIARLGAPAVVLTPNRVEAARLFPDSAQGQGIPDVSLHICDAEDLASLNETAETLAQDLQRGRGEAGLLLVRVPPEWLAQAQSTSRILRRLLLFTSSDSRDLSAAYGMTRQTLQAQPDAQIGVTIHGVSDPSAAREAGDLLAASSARNLGLELTRYGEVPDDLDIYRSITARCPIGVAHPHSPAAHALREVARKIHGEISAPPTH